MGAGRRRLYFIYRPKFVLVSSLSLIALLFLRMSRLDKTKIQPNNRLHATNSTNDNADLVSLSSLLDITRSPHNAKMGHQNVKNQKSYKHKQSNGDLNDENFGNYDDEHVAAKYLLNNHKNDVIKKDDKFNDSYRSSHEDLMELQNQIQQALNNEKPKDDNDMINLTKHEFGKVDTLIKDITNQRNDINNDMYSQTIIKLNDNAHVKIGSIPLNNNQFKLKTDEKVINYYQCRNTISTNDKHVDILLLDKQDDESIVTNNGPKQENLWHNSKLHTNLCSVLSKPTKHDHYRISVVAIDIATIIKEDNHFRSNYTNTNILIDIIYNLYLDQIMDQHSPLFVLSPTSSMSNVISMMSSFTNATQYGSSQKINRDNKIEKIQYNFKGWIPIFAPSFDKDVGSIFSHDSIEIIQKSNLPILSIYAKDDKIINETCSKLKKFQKNMFLRELNYPMKKSNTDNDLFNMLKTYEHEFQNYLLGFIVHVMDQDSER